VKQNDISKLSVYLREYSQLKDSNTVKRRTVYSKIFVSWDDWSKFMVTFKYYILTYVIPGRICRYFECYWGWLLCILL